MRSRFGIPQVSDSLCEPTNPGTDRLWTTVNGGDDQELSVANLLGHKCNQPVSNSGPSSEESVKCSSQLATFLWFILSVVASAFPGRAIILY
ncbi:hypothetical protein LXL04_011558 [Taraxacum kok-saghyz]